MPSSGTEVHSFNEVWTKKHLSLPIKSLTRPNLPEPENGKEDFDDLLHLKCRLINTAGNERSEVDVKLPYERPLLNNAHRKGSPVYNTIGKKDKPTLDEVLGSIPLVYNPFTKQLELESRNKNTRTDIDPRHARSDLESRHAWTDPELRNKNTRTDLESRHVRDLESCHARADLESYHPRTELESRHSRTELESRYTRTDLEPRNKNTRAELEPRRNGTCFPMDRDGAPTPRDCPGQTDVCSGPCDPDRDRTQSRFCHREKAEAVGGALEEEPEKGELSCLDNGVLPHTDTSSFTSMSSVGTEHSFGVGGEMQARPNSSLCYSCDNLQSLQPEEDPHKGAKPKKWGLSNLFLKLPWKSKSPIEAEEEQLEVGPRCPSACSSGSRRSDECVATSTTALILENRPPNLPAKSVEEEIKHKQLYEEMVRGARKKELQDAKFRKKQAYHQQKLEEQLINATKAWNDDILPNWNSVKDSRKTRDLWWKGLPPSIRGRVWKLAVGNDLNITQELFDICTARSKEKIWVTPDVTSCCESGEDADESHENAADFIKLDVSRTFPQLGIFQEGGPYHNTLEGILGAYVIYRPDIGYVQGMSFLAAMLLLNMDAVDSFICFCNLLNRQCQLSFFRIEQKMMTVYYSVYEEYFQENLPKLFHLFTKQNLSPDLYLVDWLYTLYSKSLPLDVACRVWDVYLRDGEEFLVKTALGILRMYEDILLEMDFIHLAQFLTKLPEDIDAEKLFHSVGAIRMTVNKKSFSSVLQHHIDSMSSR